MGSLERVLIRSVFLSVGGLARVHNRLHIRGSRLEDSLSGYCYKLTLFLKSFRFLFSWFKFERSLPKTLFVEFTFNLGFSPLVPLD